MNSRSETPTSDRPFTAYPWRFLTATLTWTWTVWSVAAVLGNEFSHPVTLTLFAIGGLGPAGTAIYLAHRERGREGMSSLWRRLIEIGRMPGRWYVWVLAVVLIPHLGMIVLVWIFWGDAGEARSAVTFFTTPVVIAGALGFMLIAVIPEEIGWRGYGLDPLLHRFNVLGASLILGFVWAIWHLPLYFIPGSFLHDSVGLFTPRYWAINAAIPLLALLHTLLYLGTARSIYSAVVFHITWNMAGEAFAPDVRADLLRLILLLLVTVVAVAHFRHWLQVQGNTRMIDVTPAPDLSKSL